MIGLMIIMKEYKINILKDKGDYEKKLTNDNVINIIGNKGSGKTTTSLKYLNNDDYIVVNCDRLLELPGGIDNIKLSKIRAMLKEKHGTIIDGPEFLEYYNDIIKYAFSKNKKIFIEGNALQNIQPITKLKGKVIIKRTALIKCFIRTIKRDYANEYFMKIEIKKYGRFGKITRFFKIINRRKNIFKQSKNIEGKIKELEELES